MTPEEILAKAADRVEQGWCQGALNDGRGNLCVLGALHYAVGKHSSLGERAPEWYRAFWAVNQEAQAEGYFDMVDYNNTPGRVKEEVSTLVRNAKRRLRP